MLKKNAWAFLNVAVGLCRPPPPKKKKKKKHATDDGRVPPISQYSLGSAWQLISCANN